MSGETMSVHPTAVVEPRAVVGRGTRVWHHAHIRDDAVIGENCVVGKGVYIDTKVVVGDRCKIQNYACLYQGTVVGDDVFIGPGVVFTNDKYPRAKYWDNARLRGIRVEDKVSVGANSTIVCGVVLYEGCMVGAGSVVTDDVLEYMLVYGNPAQVHGKVDEAGFKHKSLVDLLRERV